MVATIASANSAPDGVTPRKKIKNWIIPKSWMRNRRSTTVSNKNDNTEFTLECCNEKAWEQSNDWNNPFSESLLLGSSNEFTTLHMLESPATSDGDDDDDDTDNYNSNKYELIVSGEDDEQLLQTLGLSSSQLEFTKRCFEEKKKSSEVTSSLATVDKINHNVDHEKIPEEISTMKSSKNRKKLRRRKNKKNSAMKKDSMMDPLFNADILLDSLLQDSDSESQSPTNIVAKNEIVVNDDETNPVENKASTQTSNNKIDPTTKPYKKTITFCILPSATDDNISSASDIKSEIDDSSTDKEYIPPLSSYVVSQKNINLSSDELFTASTSNHTEPTTISEATKSSNESNEVDNCGVGDDEDELSKASDIRSEITGSLSNLGIAASSSEDSSQRDKSPAGDDVTASKQSLTTKDANNDESGKETDLTEAPISRFSMKNLFSKGLVGIGGGRRDVNDTQNSKKDDDNKEAQSKKDDKDEQNERDGVAETKEVDSLKSQIQTLEGQVDNLTVQLQKAVESKCSILELQTDMEAKHEKELLAKDEIIEALENEKNKLLIQLEELNASTEKKMHKMEMSQISALQDKDEEIEGLKEQVAKLKVGSVRSYSRRSIERFKPMVEKV